MADGTPSPIPTERQSDRFRGDESSRGDRSAGPREGGFRIRLSDNEMRSARALQEAFGLRSTVAVLGFALRTLGQQLEEGKLDELAAQHRAQMGPRSGGGTGSGRPEGRRERPEGGRSPEGRWQEGRGSGGRGAKVDPFARPSRPAVASQPVEEPSSEASLPEDLPSESVGVLPTESSAMDSEPSDVLPSTLEASDVSQPANASSEEASPTPEE
ncbi:MAG: hypothetical protein ACH34U_08310 [Cyanobium sp.]